MSWWWVFAAVELFTGSYLTLWAWAHAHDYDLRHQDLPDDWRDSDNERTTAEQHEPIARDA